MTSIIAMALVGDSFIAESLFITELRFVSKIIANVTFHSPTMTALILGVAGFSTEVTFDL
jgi:hypothetical protein